MGWRGKSLWLRFRRFRFPGRRCLSCGGLSVLGDDFNRDFNFLLEKLLEGCLNIFKATLGNFGQGFGGNTDNCSGVFEFC